MNLHLLIAIFAFIVVIFSFIPRFKLVGEVPLCRKAVLIGYPHTSNWDTVFALMLAIRHPTKLVMKHYTWLIAKLFGHIVLDKRSNLGATKQIATQICDSKFPIWLALYPEGTREAKRY